MRNSWVPLFIAFCFTMSLTGCGHQSALGGSRITGDLSAASYKEVQFNQHQKLWFRASPSGTAAHIRLRVYIEGDGAPWWRRQIPPADPTPRVSVVAGLAALDHAPKVAYLARPCQWLADASLCPQSWWTVARFGEDVIDASMRSLDWLMLQAHASELELIGHSGGGTLAILLAARRKDVRCVITLASPLDTEEWTRAMSVGPLTGSNNPQELSSGLQDIAMWHYFGSKDEIAPEKISRRFLSNWPHAKSMVIEGWGHTKPWASQPERFQKGNCLMTPEGH